MLTLILVIMLIDGETWSRPVLASECQALAEHAITRPEVSSAACWTRGTGMRPVFSTVSL